jgi:hypothetical protein
MVREGGITAFVPLGRTPWGYVELASQRHPPEVFWTALPSRLSPKGRSPGTGQNAGQYLEQAGHDQQKGSATGSAKHFAGVVMRRRFSGFGPNAVGRRRAGLSGGWSCDLVVVRRVAGTAMG